LYSSLLQQCLIELGVTPYDLNDQYQQSDDATGTQQTLQPANVASTQPTSPQLTRPRPQATKTALADNPVDLSETKAEAPTVVDYWKDCSPELISDLAVLFPQMQLSVMAFNHCLAQLKDQLYWNIAPKAQVQYVQMESIDQNIMITSPLPNELSLSQKKELWLLLQPHTAQQNTES
jgi:hypothetical protein